MASKPMTTPALGDLLGRLLGRRGRLRESRKIEEVRKAWIACAGEEITRHTRVSSLKNGVLTIEVDSPAVCHRLAGFEKDGLLVKLTEKAAKIHVTGLRFKLGAFAEE